MTRFPDGGSSLYQAKRPLMQPVIIVLIAATVFLAACGATVANQNWPGLAQRDGRVYVAYGPSVAAIDVTERDLLWTYPEEPSQTLLFYARPSLADERIVIGDFGASGGLFSPQATVTVYALSQPEGENSPPSLLWSRDDVATDRIIAPALQTESQVFIGTADNHVYALDVNSGDLQWEFETGHSVWAQPVFSEGRVYVASLDNSVYALDAQNGDLLWQTTMDGAIASRPTLNDGLLYVPSFDRQLHALDVDTGDEAWTADAENWVWGSPLVQNGTVYYADIDGNIFAVDAASGEEQWTVAAQGAVQSSPVYDDGVLFVTAGETEGEEEERQGQILALDAGNGDQLWQRETPAPVFSSPVMVDDSVVIVFQEGDVSRLLVYEKDDGAQVWEFTLPNE